MHLSSRLSYWNYSPFQFVHRGTPHDSQGPSRLAWSDASWEVIADRIMEEGVGGSPTTSSASQRKSTPTFKPVLAS